MCFLLAFQNVQQRGVSQEMPSPGWLMPVNVEDCKSGQDAVSVFSRFSRRQQRRYGEKKQRNDLKKTDGNDY